MIPRRSEPFQTSHAAGVCARHVRGATLVEVIVAVPVVLLFGLMLVQMVFAYQARQLLQHALHEAVREAAVDQARPEALRSGLARGLVPYLMKGEGLGDYAAARVAAVIHVTEGTALGWIALRQLAPFAESHDDWEETALDPLGQRLTGVMEIPNDNLDGRRIRMSPRHGNAGRRGEEAIGARSGQTLSDANLLKVEMTYGVRLNVPLAGPALRLAMMAAHGCIGLGAITRTRDCLILSVHRRLPVRLSAMARMMSPARRSSMTLTRSAAGAQD